MPADWHLVPCLAKLRDELNAIAPGRDKASDGTIGDKAHADRSSSHNPDETGAVPIRDADKVNEVHALDVDADLRTPGLDMERVVQFVLARCRSGAERRLRNIIWNRRIWAASSGWRQQDYTGSNPHNHHAHFEASYESAREASTASWHLEDIPVALNEADKKWISDLFAQSRRYVDTVVEQRLDAYFEGGRQSDNTPTSKIGRDAWGQGIPNPHEGGKRTTAYKALADVATEQKRQAGVLEQVVEALKAKNDAEPPPAGQ